MPQSFQRQDLRDRICRDALNEAVEGIGTVTQVTRALAVYAALAPVMKGRTEVRDLAAELSGVAAARVDSLLERVLTAGLFQESADGSIRPVPDLFGDLLLEEVCLDSQGRPSAFSKQMLDRLFETDPQATVTNCIDIGQLFGAEPNTDLLSERLLVSARSASVDRKSEVKKLLQSSLPLAVRRPQTLLQVAGSLETRGVLRRAPPAHELSGNDSVEMNMLGLLMRAGEVQPDIVPTALQWGRDLYNAARGDDPSSHHVLGVLRGTCRFASGSGLPHARAVANTLRSWVSEPDAGAAMLASTLSAQFLTLDAGLNPTPDVCAIRDIAVDTIVKAIKRPESEVQYAALAALEQYARTEDPANTPAETWHSQLGRELDGLAKAVGEVSAATMRLPVWATAELRGWHWWMQTSAPLRVAGKAILTSIQTTDAYQLWKALHSQALPVTLEVPEDPGSRVDYFQGLGAQDEGERAQKLFDVLSPRVLESEAWRTLWLTVFDQVPALALQVQAGAVIGEFARRHPDAAWSFINDADARGPLFAILPLLLDELGRQDRVRRSEEAGRVNPGTQLEAVWLRALGMPQDLNEGERRLLTRALGSTDRETIHHSARALLNSSEHSPVEVFDAVFAAIKRHPDDGVLWELVLERFAHWGAKVLPPAENATDEAVTKVASSLIPLMRTFGSQLRWGFQPYTRQLDRVLGVLAVASPARLREWTEQHWGGSNTGAGSWSDASPLNISRFRGALRSIRDSAAAATWIDVFAAWIKGPRPLGEIAARELAALCALNEPRVTALAEQVAARPTKDALQSFTDFVGHHASKRDFATHSLALLEVWSQYPAAYATVEDAVIQILVRESSGRSWPGQANALDVIEARRAAGGGSPVFCASLQRAEREVREAMNAASGEGDEGG